MAKAKKQTPTQENLFEQVLIPKAEQPYPVPENWVWVRFQTIKQDAESFFDGDWILSENMDINGTVRLIQLSDIGIGEFLNKSSRFISEKTFDDLQCSELFTGDVLISRMAEPIARSCIMPKLETKCITAVDVAVIRCENSIIINKYLNWLCNSTWFTKLAEGQARGTTRTRITRKNLGNMPIPLPPLPEQHRIVERIESLFEKLDRAKELAQSALDSFETRKAAILHKAFIGELTAKWREENGVRLEEWEEKTLSQISEIITGSTPNTKKTEYFNGNIPFIKPTELNQGRHVYSSNETLSELGKSVSRGIRAGATCVCCIGATISKCGYLTVDAVTNQQINSIIPNKNMDDLFVYYYCSSDKFKQKLIENSSSTTLPIINKFRMSNLLITVPSLLEQQEIVRILDRLFEKERRAKEMVEVVEKIDLMKKAILASAFRGELGTNEAEEKSAMEILSERLKKQDEVLK